MDFVRGDRGRADRVVVGVFDMRKVDVPVVLMSVANHGNDLCHCMVNAFYATVTAGVVGAGREFADAEKLIYCSCQLGTKLRSVIGQEGGWAKPERDVAVHQDIGGAFCGEFCRCDSEHVRAAAEAIREKVDRGSK